MVFGKCYSEFGNSWRLDCLRGGETTAFSSTFFAISCILSSGIWATTDGNVLMRQRRNNKRLLCMGATEKAKRSIGSTRMDTFRGTGTAFKSKDQKSRLIRSRGRQIRLQIKSESFSRKFFNDVTYSFGRTRTTRSSFIQNQLISAWL